MEIEFVNCSEVLPPYGVPVLIIIGSAVQHITYTRDGADDSPDWFEPFYFDHDNDLKIFCSKVSKWSYLPEFRGK